MAEETKRPVISTKCPKCGQVVRFYSPGKACVVRVTCTNGTCRHVFGVKIGEAVIRLANGGARQQPASTQVPQSAIPQSAVPQAPLQPMPQSASPQPQPSPQPPSVPTEFIVNRNGRPTGPMARLLQKKRFFFKGDKWHALHIGDNTIGMYDPASPSDIMIEGDTTISHRSVTITVEAVGSAYKYLLTVNKATNKVRLAGRPLPVGTAVYMQTGQELVLGKTHLYLMD